MSGTLSMAHTCSLSNLLFSVLYVCLFPVSQLGAVLLTVWSLLMFPRSVLSGTHLVYVLSLCLVLTFGTVVLVSLSSPFCSCPLVHSQKKTLVDNKEHRGLSLPSCHVITYMGVLDGF